MSSGEFVEHVEAMKDLDAAKLIRMVLDGAATSVHVAQDQAREAWGSTVQGISVNEPLVDLHRELGEAERAIRNALNALAIVTGAAPAAPAPLPATKDLGRPFRERTS